MILRLNLSMYHVPIIPKQTICATKHCKLKILSNYGARMLHNNSNNNSIPILSPKFPCTLYPTYLSVPHVVYVVHIWVIWYSVDHVKATLITVVLMTSTVYGIVTHVCQILN